jgi:hypothetical protein
MAESAATISLPAIARRNAAIFLRASSVSAFPPIHAVAEGLGAPESGLR